VRAIARPLLGAAGLLLVSARLAGAASTAELAAQVRAAETAFAKTMADRDQAAFATFIADEAVFFGGGVLRGKAAVVEGWKPIYADQAAPFSWRPEEVEVLDSGKLAISSGPVYSPDGKRSGTFNSIWRLEPDGKWRVIFDKGCPPCNCGK
jgi:ketosteroid isomerase-like protein